MRRAFILVAVITTVAVAGYLAWDRLPRTAQAYFDSGNKYFAEGKYSEASLQLLNAIRVDPHHRESHYLLARISAIQGNLAGAAFELRSLTDDYPDDIQANLELGRIYLLAAKVNPSLFQQARDVAQRLLKKYPDSVEALIMSGNASAGLQDYKSSAEALQKATNLDPQNGEAFVSLGLTEGQQKKYPEAERAFLRAREIDPNDKAALISLANYYRIAGEPAKAEAVFRDAVAKYPADREVYTLTVLFFAGLNRLDEAEKVLSNAQAHDSQNPSPSLMLANMYEGTNRVSAARKVLLELKSQFPKSIEVAAQLARNLLSDRPQEARVEIDRILKNDPQNALGYILLGELQVKTGQFDAAEATLGNGVITGNSFPQAHFILGGLALRRHQFDAAQDHYQKAIAMDKEYLPARIALADVFLNKQQWGDAREQVRQVLQERPANLAARLMKTSIDIQTKNYGEAERELMLLAKERPDDPVVQRQMGIYHQARGNTLDAEKSFLRVLQLTPNSEEDFQNLILLYLNSNQVNRAIERLNTVRDADKQAFHFELMGMAEDKAGRVVEAENAYRRGLDKDPNRSTTEQLLYTDYVQSGKFDEALKILDQRLKRNPSDAASYLSKGNIYQQQGKIEEAKNSYRQALEKDSSADLAAINLANILADQGQDLPSALTMAQTVRRRHPELAAVADTVGWIYFKLDRTVLATEEARFATSKQPDNGLYWYHLGMMYKRNYQIEDAQAAFKKAVASKKQFKARDLAESALKEIEP